MRLTNPISVFSHRHRHDPGRKMRQPSALPTIIPTRSSYLQRLLWLFAVAR